MTIATWLRHTTARLEEAGIETARLDTLILLEDCLHTDRTRLLAHDDQELPAEHISELEPLLLRRLNHEPLAYIRGKSEFYGREFAVDENVLVPRPESETIIDLFKQLPLATDISAADIGTGSGALAISAKLERPGLDVQAVDIDPACLEVAAGNARKHDAEVRFEQGDLLVPLFGYEVGLVLLCNLPYVPTDYPINRAAGHEPALALFAGDDGLDLYRKLFAQTDQLAKKPPFILTESLPMQHPALVRIAASHGYNQQNSEDLIQVFAVA